MLKCFSCNFFDVVFDFFKRQSRSFFHKWIPVLFDERCVMSSIRILLKVGVLRVNLLKTEGYFQNELNDKKQQHWPD